MAIQASPPCYLHRPPTGTFVVVVLVAKNIATEVRNGWRRGLHHRFVAGLVGGCSIAYVAVTTRLVLQSAERNTRLVAKLADDVLRF